MVDRGDEWDGPPTAEAKQGGGAFVLRIVGEGFVSSHPLPQRGTVRIGRAEGLEIRLDDPSVSRQHAALHLGRFPAIEDLGSANGTELGGRRLTPHQRAPLAPGDAIQLGDLHAILLGGPVPATPQVGAPEVVVLDPTMVELHRLVARVAPSEVSVLLLGETGVGKEVIAQLLHRSSPRRAAPLVEINCAALSESLLESELFGHEKGAFTGATEAKDGLLASAEGGTVFLDEVGELPLAMQAKLLRVIEHKQVLRVGSLRPRSIDVRFIAATNRVLEEEVEAGRFRRDLYFRLNGVSLLIPPLRERPSEILPLARRFLESGAARIGRETPTLSPAAAALLEQHPWPGNVRELLHAMERALLLADAEVLPQHLPARAPGVGRAPSREELTPQAAAERDRILAALADCGGNQTQAAKKLGISRGTLLMRMDAFELERPRKRSPYRQ